MNFLQYIVTHISEQTGTRFSPPQHRANSFDTINQTTRLTDGQQDWFVKTNSANKLDMFEAEAEGLNAMHNTQSIRVARALCTGSYEDNSYIVIEYIHSGRATRHSQAMAGERLAAMHREVAKQFGWHRNNTIGATFQRNTWTDDWITFWRDQRLNFQLELAAQNGFSGRLQSSGERLLSCFHHLIDHAPQASLLHGDLWSGNISYNLQGEPVIFDPACYFGDREADIAMTELFGGFNANFYTAYNATWPLDTGYQTRKSLYNLYHILNHLNLFGAGYAGQAQNLIDRLLSEC